MSTLASIRAKLMAQQQQSKKTGSADKTLFAHWNIDEGESSLIRFLPDADTTNDFFWVERLQIKLPFSGIKGKTDKHVLVVVPCMEQWGENCPVLTEIRPWFKDKSLEEVARKYWKKRSYILQGFVRENPLEEEGIENPIRRFMLTPELFKLVREGIMDPEIEEIPTHFEHGLDFRIKKGSKGGFADYSTSGWARRESALTIEEKDAIEKHGLFDLKEFLPKKPTDVELQAISEMFQASVDGEQYDPDRWAQYYKPYGMENLESDSTTETSTASAPVVTHKVTKSVVHSEKESDDGSSEVKEVSGASDKRAQDILNMIRNRKTQ